MSRMPSASPSSQCGFGAKASLFGSSFRTMTLSCSSLPFGTRGSMTFGIQRAFSSRSASSAPSSTSISLIFSPTSRMRAFTASVGGPPLLALFPSAWSCSFCARKWRDFSRTVPPHLVELIGASAAAGRRTVVLFEDWQTAEAAINTAGLLVARGLRAAAALLWNANNTYGFDRVDFALLRRAASITTISRYMRGELAAVGVDAAILPNGIAERWLRPLPPGEPGSLRAAFGERPAFVKVARFDQDKRWLWSIDAIAIARSSGLHPRLLMRGSRSPYAEVVGARIRAQGLSVDRVALSAQATSDELASAVGSCHGDIVFLDFFIPERVLRALYQAAEGVLANSEKEPFGLVGLEVMASGGIVYVGRTGEDYAVPFGNCVVMQSDDPRELLTAYQTLRTRPELAVAIRSDGRATAKRFVWSRILY